MSKLGSALKTLTDFRFHRHLLRRLGALRDEFHAPKSDSYRAGEGTLVSPEANLIATGVPIELGRGVYIGRRTKLESRSNEKIVIGDYSSIQDGTVLDGEVTLGRHCLLSLNIFISSGNHVMDLRPAWLIRDQDTLAGISKSPVVIGDDVWIGWGAFIKRGTYIGRGSVIGSYAVVTHDVPPYSIQAGIPSREIKKRLNFEPPSHFGAANPEHLPYFYSGFDLRQVSLGEGVVWAYGTSSLMTQRGPWRELILEGKLQTGIDSLRLQVSVNGIPVGEVILGAQAFRVSIPLDPQVCVSAPSLRSKVLDLWLEVELKTDAGEFAWGITTVRFL